MSTGAAKAINDTILYLQKKKARGVRHLHLNPESVKIPKAAKKDSGYAPKTSAQSISVREEGKFSPAALEKRLQKSSPATPSVKKGDLNERKKAFEALREKANACRLCPHLVSFRKQVVFGVGNMDADLMFVGEAPGADEDDQGEPFVGRAGQLLTKMIQAMNFERSDIYIANILKCRPNVDTPSGNRKPTPEEMETCIPFLKEQIKIIQPKVLVALGDTAVKGLVPSLKTGITKLRGSWLAFEDIPVMPTFHPAYLLRNQTLALKRTCWEDMLAVLERLGKPISEKQRGYFLSAITNQ